jgi:hypothetical protein
VTIPTTNDDVLVRNLLATARVPASEEEITLIVSNYKRMKSMIDILYAVPEARYESPGLHFTATPTFAEWG